MVLLLSFAGYSATQKRKVMLWDFLILNLHFLISQLCNCELGCVLQSLGIEQKLKGRK
jgi:hypothetical protein